MRSLQPEGTGPGRKILFCADDFGASRGVNQGILEAYSQGPVRRASALAVGFALDEAAELAGKAPDLEVGLHFSLTLGRPLSQGGRNLAGKDGAFPPVERLLARSLSGRIDPAGVREELEAQWEALLEAGLTPTYLDGHQHVHLFPRVFEAVLGFLEDHPVGRVRILGEPLFLPPRRRLSARFILGRFSRRAARRLERAGRPVREKTLGLCLWQAHPLEGALQTLLSGIPPGKWEVFTHPRYPDPDFEKLDPESRKGPDPGLAELRVLTGRSFLEWLTRREILPPPPRGISPTGPTSE